jgi:hypothetical protein
MDPIKIDPLYPQTIRGPHKDFQYLGISKREYIATQLLTALIAKNSNNSFKFLVDMSLEMADELIEKAQNQQDNVESKHNNG